jgi:hypothetical protein
MKQVEIWLAFVPKAAQASFFVSKYYLKTKVLDSIDCFNQTMAILFRGTYHERALTA